MTLGSGEYRLAVRDGVEYRIDRVFACRVEDIQNGRYDIALEN